MVRGVFGLVYLPRSLVGMLRGFRYLSIFLFFDLQFFVSGFCCAEYLWILDQENPSPETRFSGTKQSQFWKLRVSSTEKIRKAS